MPDRAVITCIKTVNKKKQDQIINQRKIWYITGSDKWNRKKTSTIKYQEVK